jgi:hypothetical protein
MIGFLFGAFSELAGFGRSFLFRLRTCKYCKLYVEEFQVTFSFSFCAFFSAFFEGPSAPVAAGASSLMVDVLN